MNHVFTATRSAILNLLIASKRAAAQQFFYEMVAEHGRESVERQTWAQSGPLIEEMERRTKEWSRRNENIEVFWALQLSDFYFPHDETNISFEIRRDIDPASITTYEGLTSSFESATHIDCRVATPERTLNFQIKRYLSQYLGAGHDDFMRWLNEEVIAHYGNMNGTILAIPLMPEAAYTEMPIRFDELHENLIGRPNEVSFDQVILLYNDAGTEATSHEVFPGHHRLIIPEELARRRFRGEA